jgi:hypothetical protein
VSRIISSVIWIIDASAANFLTVRQGQETSPLETLGYGKPRLDAPNFSRFPLSITKDTYLTQQPYYAPPFNRFEVSNALGRVASTFEVVPLANHLSQGDWARFRVSRLVVLSNHPSQEDWIFKFPIPIIPPGRQQRSEVAETVGLTFKDTIIAVLRTIQGIKIGSSPIKSSIPRGLGIQVPSITSGELDDGTEIHTVSLSKTSFIRLTYRIPRFRLGSSSPLARR